MSTTEQSLYQAILQGPDDDAHRLVYADWLDDHGVGERAEFIRTQIELARGEDCGHAAAEDGCRRCELARAEASLLERHGGEWLRRLPRSGWKAVGEAAWQKASRESPRRSPLACFRRGFVAWVDLPTDEFTDCAHVLVNHFPLERVRLSDRRPLAAEVGYSWACDFGPDRPERLPHGLAAAVIAYDELDGEPEDIAQRRWETEAGALVALSEACLRYGREYGLLGGLGGSIKKVFTTGQVAKILQVGPRTVAKWFDSGKLKGYRIPGSNDRRIPREHLLRFIREQGLFAPPPESHFRPREHSLEVAPAVTAHDGLAERQAFLESARTRATFTTGEVARICCVAPRRVVKWIDSGRLAADREGERRLVRRESLVRFLRDNGMPLVGLEEEATA
jgi:uncharacterized protein (TIGR02996 family)/excisionase family DNA binding protein